MVADRSVEMLSNNWPSNKLTLFNNSSEFFCNNHHYGELINTEFWLGRLLRSDSEIKTDVLKRKT